MVPKESDSFNWSSTFYLLGVAWNLFLAGSAVDSLWIYILFGKYWVNDAVGCLTCLSVGKVSHAGPKPG